MVLCIKEIQFQSGNGTVKSMKAQKLLHLRRNFNDKKRVRCCRGCTCLGYALRIRLSHRVGEDLDVSSALGRDAVLNISGSSSSSGGGGGGGGRSSARRRQVAGGI